VKENLRRISVSPTLTQTRCYEWVTLTRRGVSGTRTVAHGEPLQQPLIDGRDRITKCCGRGSTVAIMRIKMLSDSIMHPSIHPSCHARPRYNQFLINTVLPQRQKTSWPCWHSTRHPPHSLQRYLYHHPVENSTDLKQVTVSRCTARYMQALLSSSSESSLKQMGKSYKVQNSLLYLSNP
jgi:hypothetical protein